MTTLIVNDMEPIELATTGNDSVFDVLLAAQDHWDSSHSIDRLEVDGLLVEPLEESTLMAIPAHDVAVKITLTPPQERSFEQTVDEASDYLTQLAAGFENVAGQIRTQNNSEAHTMMRDGLEGLAKILQLVDHLLAKQALPDDIRSGFDSFLAELQEKSVEMTDAQESGDPTLIADILEYEMVDAVADLKAYLLKIKPLVI